MTSTPALTFFHSPNTRSTGTLTLLRELGAEYQPVSYTHLDVYKRQFIRSVQVPDGFDVADNEIVKRLSAGDLVITSDLPLAAEVIENCLLYTSRCV